jgi:hypothetical protein
MSNVERIALYLLLGGVGFACESPDDEDLSINEIEEALIVAPDFGVGLQLTDYGTSSAHEGDWAYTSSYETGTSESDWACDDNCYHPDAAKVAIYYSTADGVKNKDFRFCLVGSGGRSSHTQIGRWKCTPWASEGGGSSGMATDSNALDPDSYKIRVETRNWVASTPDKVVDFRLSIRGYDYNGADDPGPGPWSSATPWVSEGGGESGWGCDQNCYGPDGFELRMEVRNTDIWDFCSPTYRCQHGYGDCDSNNDCAGGATCVQNVGAQYGYADKNIDVCVD